VRHTIKIYPPPPPAPVRLAPLALWRVAQALLHTLYALFGAPEDVAFRGTLTREARGLLASWLRCAATARPGARPRPQRPSIASRGSPTQAKPRARHGARLS